MSAALGGFRHRTARYTQAGGLHAGQTRTYQYDALDRLSSVTEGGLTTRYAYDAGDLLRHTYDPEDRHTETTYDVLGRATAMIQHMAEGEPALVTAYENYDGEGNARLVRDPLGQETTLTYDGLGRLTDVTLPAPLGEVAAGLPRLLSTHAAYDGGDYVTAVTETLEPDGGGAAFTRELTWDHDAFGRMTRHGQRGRDVTYTYNDSLRQMAQASSGGTTLYQYDALGRIDWAELDGDRVDVSYVEHEDLVSTVTNPNGTVATFGYDAATRRLTGVTHTRGGTAFLAYGYAYDHNGNRTLETVTEGGSEERNEYTYDALDRMTLHRRETGATPGPGDIRETRYAFELGGARGYNRRVEDVQDGGGQELARRVYDYDDANRLTTLSETGGATRTVTYAHDANGNRLSRVDSAAGGEQTLYRYTVQNQLSEVLAGPAGAEVSQGQYEYDALGRRVRQHGTQRGDIETVYDGLSTLDEHEVSGGGAGTQLGHYHYALGLARLDEGGGEERYYHLDGRGNTGALTAGNGGADTPGDVLTSYRLDPFGAVRSGSDPVNRQVYTGHETDTETGLIYMNARHYDPETGRLVTQDTWLGTGGDPGTQNRYAYALGNPATYWDPTGHWTEVYPGGCTSGKDKCEQAAGGQGGIPYPEDSSVIPLGGPSPSSAAPAPQTQAARPTPPAPRGTFSVISGSGMPAHAYNAVYASVQARRVDEHTEVTQEAEGETTSANAQFAENLMSQLQAWRGGRAEAAAERRAQAEALDAPLTDPAFWQNWIPRVNLGIEQGAQAIPDMAGGLAELAGHGFLGGAHLGAGAMTAAGGALAFILGDSQAAEVLGQRAWGFFGNAGEHAYSIIEAYLGWSLGNLQSFISDPVGAAMPMSPMVQMRRALSLSLGDFDAWANVTTEGLMAIGGLVLGKTLSAFGSIGRGAGMTAEARGGGALQSFDHTYQPRFGRMIRPTGVNPLSLGRLRQTIAQSEIGRRILAFADDGIINLETSAAHVEPRLFGESIGRTGIAYLRNTQSYARTAETLIHEGVHALGIGGSRRAEAIARLAERAHRGQPITRAVMREVLLEMRAAGVYADLPWSLGQTSKHLPGIRF